MINNSEKIYIVRCGETALKGQNKSFFERMLVQRIKKLLTGFEGVTIERVDGLIFVRTPLDSDEKEVLKSIGRVFGVESISPASEIVFEGMDAESAMAEIGSAAASFAMGLISDRNIKTFKIDARRADKMFPIESPQIARRMGAAVLKGCRVLKVDVHQPDATIFVNVRRGRAYICETKVTGFGGLPLGTNGKGLV
ncbi:MAG: tRNA 4-thiouridine(8) synthase ThiI, partial [Firmicutes bacterium]|nr:tRNA 4-thiouridine(8) synthase ThiI [Bacillota bacterium]